MRRILLSLSFLACSVTCLGQLVVPPDRPIRIGRNPSLSPDGDKLCFGYQGNLWVAPSTGGVATRLTANDSNDTNPRWSPDGRWIAFNSDREGGNQVFLIPSSGGPARQLTFYASPPLFGTSATAVYDWFPDGKSLLVTTSRETRRESIYRMDVETGRLKLLVSDDMRSTFPALSPDGKWIAYTRGGLSDTIRKGYRGAANYDIWVVPTDLATPPKRLTDSDKNDMWPAWSKDSRTVYYCSERGGISTVWKQARDGGKPVQVVQSPPDAVRFLASSRRAPVLAYEADRRIFTVFENAPPKEAKLICRTDERGPKTTYATYSGNNVSEFAVSPDGKRTALIIRGDIFVCNNDKPGDARRVTDTPAKEVDVQWSPDGKRLVYASNRTGSYRLYLFELATRETKPLTTGDGIDTDPFFSPDGKWIAFLRAPKTGIFAIKPDGTGEQLLIQGPKISEFRWSPDSKWVAYTREDDIRGFDEWIAPLSPDGGALKAGAPINVTDHPGINQGPRWTADGAKLLFRSNRYRNRDVETLNHEGKYALYATSLEREKEKLDEEDDPLKPSDVKPTDAKPVEKKPAIVKVDPREIERRAKSIVGLEEGVRAFEVSPDGKTVAFVSSVQGQPDIWQAAVEGGTVTRLTTSGENPLKLAWSPDSTRIYFLATGAIRWIPKGGGPGGSVGFTARMQIDRAVDYRAVFDEAWQVLNDHYYDRTFHGVDWKAVGEKYRSLLGEVSTRRDLNYLVGQMLGELNSSHTGFGDLSSIRPVRETANLGIWADQDFAGPGVRVASVLARSPAYLDESRLKPGDVILKIDGEEASWGASYDRALADKVGRTVTLELAAVGGAPRTVKIKPIGRAAWAGLMYEKWIDERRAIADKASGGRLGYLHVADMGDAARNRFERELYSIGMRKDGMIIDLRDNQGGDTHDSLLRMLVRNRHYFNMAPRTETPFPQPERAYTKPIILLINEQSLSDAEVFANGFREYGLGKIVGTPTMGWIIFTYGERLVDGSILRVPAIGCYTLDGRDMENWGVPPDIRVENSPADVAAGKDVQLERAVEELMKDRRVKK